MTKFRWGLALLLSASVGARAAQSPDTALAAVTKAANNHDSAAAAKWAVGGKPGVFPWIKPAGLLSSFMGGSTWKSALLPPPFSNAAQPLAVFHTWHSCEADGDHIQPLVRTGSGWRFGPEISERDTQGYRITHHVLFVGIGASIQKAFITDSVTVIREGRTPPVAFLRISDDFNVSAVKFNGSPVPYQQAGGVIAVQMPPGKSVTLLMVYSGKVDHPSFTAIKSDYALLNAYYYPVIGRLPASADTVMTLPHGWKGVTQGELISSSDDGRNARFAFRNVLPVNYFSIAAGKYHQRSRKFGKVTLTTDLLADNPKLSDQLIDALELALPYYERRFGPFPYTHYTLADGGSVMGFAALEGYSFATYGTATLSPFVVAHELSHTWWGGVIPNTYLRSWWNESFASYSDDSFSRLRNHITELHPTTRAWWPGTDSIDDFSLATGREDARNIDALAYKKGQTVLRMIEGQVGTPTFDKILREFVVERRSTLDTDWPDFERAVEKVTGASWHVFFGQWVGRAGWPQLRLERASWTKTDDGYVVKASLVQDGTPYQLDVPILVRTGGELKSTVIHTQGASAPVEILVAEQPTEIVLDPTFSIPRDIPADDASALGYTFDAAGKGIPGELPEDKTGAG